MFNRERQNVHLSRGLRQAHLSGRRAALLVVDVGETGRAVVGGGDVATLPGTGGRRCPFTLSFLPSDTVDFEQ